MKENWIYIGIFLDEKSKNKLKKLYPAPTGWKEYYDHMTVVFNDETDIAKAVKSINAHNIGKKFTLRVVGPGISDKAYAIQVELPQGVVSANKITHITLATSEIGSAVDSNYITNWGTIYKSKVCSDLFVTGEMRVFAPDNKLLMGTIEEANVY